MQGKPEHGLAVTSGDERKTVPEWQQGTRRYGPELG